MRKIVLIVLLSLLVAFIGFFTLEEHNVPVEFDSDITTGQPFLQLGHAENITSLTLSPNGNILASGSQDKTIKLWDMKSNKTIGTLNVHTKNISSIIFSHDNKILIFPSIDKSFFRDRRSVIKLWDIDKQKEIATLEGYEYEDEIVSMSLSPNGKILATSNGYTIKLWDMETKKEINMFYGGCSKLTFSPDGKMLATIDYTEVVFWDLKGKKIFKFVGDKEITSISFNKNSILAIGIKNKTIKLLDVKKKKIIKILKGHKDVIYSVSFLENGTLASVSKDKTVKFWDIQKFKVNSTINITKNIMDSILIDFSLDGNYFVFSEIILENRNNYIQLFDSKTKKRLDTLGGDTFPVTSVAFSSNKEVFAFGTWGRAGIINIKDKITISLIDNEFISYVNFIKFSPNGKYFLAKDTNRSASYFEMHILKVLDRQTRKKVFKFNARNGTFSSDSKKIAYFDETTINIYDIEKKKLQTLTETVGFGTSSIKFSPNENILVCGHILWNFKKNKIIKVWDKGIFLDFNSNNEAFVLNKEEGKIVLWDINTKEILSSYDCAINNFFTFSSNDKSFVFSSGESIVLYDMENKEWSSFIGHKGYILSLDYSPNGEMLISGGEDGVIKFWDIKNKKELLTLSIFGNEEWVAITPEGYFNTSKNGAKHLNVLTAPLKVTSIDAYYEKFYRPDIVKLALQGKIVDTGLKMSDIKPAPSVEIVGLPNKTTKKQIEVTLKLKDMGGGVGDIRIYRNGTAISLESRTIQRSQQEVVTKKYTIPLEKGKNKIEAIAFESTNSAKSEPPATATIMANYSNHSKPSLHAVVIGIEEFRNQKLNLRYTKADATALKETLERYSKPLFDSVNITLLTSKEETSKENISKVLTKMKSLNPNDMFLLFVASHGVVDDGSYYLITSNVGSTSTKKLKQDALSQEEITKLISNIPTGKKIILLDTCSAGALGDSIQLALLTRGMSEDTAIKILSRATGTTILSASLSTQQALEDYKGHGLFSYVLLEGLKKEADLNGDGFVKTPELVDYVDERVPELSEQVFGVEQFPTVNLDGQSFPVTRVE